MTLTLPTDTISGDVPRKGNVDRNSSPPKVSVTSLADVPRKGNVDRNTGHKVLRHIKATTFPARGTWIEMPRE